MRMVASVAAFMLGVASPASAAMIEGTYQFSATFDSGPITNIDGQISISFDNTKTGPATVTSFSSGALKDYYTGAEFQISDDGYFYMLFGNCIAGTRLYGCGLNSSKKDYLAVFEVSDIGDVIGDPLSIEYTVAKGPEDFFQSTVSVKRIKQIPAVPEPATWAMMLLGFGVVGYSMRRRQKVAVRFA